MTSFTNQSAFAVRETKDVSGFKAYAMDVSHVGKRCLHDKSVNRYGHTDALPRVNKMGFCYISVDFCAHFRVYRYSFKILYPDIISSEPYEEDVRFLTLLSMLSPFWTGVTLAIRPVVRGQVMT